MLRPTTLHSFELRKGNLEIKRRPQTIDFPQIAGKTYGAPDFAVTATSNSGLPVTFRSASPAIISVTNGIVKILRAGAASVTAEQAGNNNYLPATAITRTFTIQRAPLQVTAENKSKFEGEANPALTVVYAGFVYGETEAVLTQPAVPSTNVVPSTPPGTYDIFPGTATADNYVMSYVKGVLTVRARGLQPQTITFPQLAGKTYGDADIAPGATTTSPWPYAIHR